VWEQRHRQTRLRLSGPVGLNSTTIISDGQRLELQRGDEPARSWDISSTDAIAANTGWDLPLQALPYWIKGLPAPAGEVENLLLQQDQAQGFTQDGWQVEYQEYRQFGELALPTRLLISRGETRVRLILRNWTALPV
jgi:outer membrane lipoprotein LolB